METGPRGFERASDKLTQEQLDTPIDEVVVEAPTESVPETLIEAVPAIAEEPAKESEVETEEEKVPKSRFLTMHQRAVDAEKAVRAFEAERATRPEVVEPLADDESLRKQYVEIFGESETTDKLYKAELARLTSIEEKAADRAYERFSQRESQEKELIDRRVKSFDQAFEELSISTGKVDFSDDEQVAILDVVEKYSPKDKDGKLIADFLMPLDQAYEIYQLNTEPKVAAKKAERNAVASLSGARSEGAPSSAADTEWQPGRERRWWDKVK